MCWDYFSFRASLQGISHAGIQKGLIALSSQASGLVKTKGLEKGHLVPRCGLGGMGFFFLFSLLFPGIPEFQFRENSRSRILRVRETIDRLIRRSPSAIA
jgi:hypothetical protein